MALLGTPIARPPVHVMSAVRHQGMVTFGCQVIGNGIGGDVTMCGLAVAGHVHAQVGGITIHAGFVVAMNGYSSPAVGGGVKATQAA